MFNSEDRRLSSTKYLKKTNVKVLGTPIESIDAAEDREKFDELLEACGIPAPPAKRCLRPMRLLGGKPNQLSRALRPSYVLGGQGMQIAYEDDDIREFMYY